MRPKSTFLQDRYCHGEYHTLFDTLKKDPKKFFLYTRMNLETFQYILMSIGSSLLKSWCNFHNQPIQPEEKLVITLRYIIHCLFLVTYSIGKN